MAPRNPLSCYFISCFTISVALSNNRSESSRELTILIKSSISSFEMNKVNLLPPLTTPCSFIVLLTLSNKDNVTLFANLSKTFLVKKIAKPNNAFFPNLPIPLPKFLPKNPLDSIILYN